MTITELSEKAEFIAERHRCLQSHWHSYCNTLVQAITLSKYKLQHSIGCEPETGVSFWLFDHFLIRVLQAEDFNSHVIYYQLESRDGQQRVQIASARLSDDGLLDGRVNIQDRQQVLEHYLERIGAVYDCLYQAVQRDAPLDLSAITAGLSRPTLA